MILGDFGLVFDAPAEDGKILLPRTRLLKCMVITPERLHATTTIDDRAVLTRDDELYIFRLNRAICTEF